MDPMGLFSRVIVPLGATVAIGTLLLVAVTYAFRTENEYIQGYDRWEDGGW